MLTQRRPPLRSALLAIVLSGAVIALLYAFHYLPSLKTSTLPQQPEVVGLNVALAGTSRDTLTRDSSRIAENAGMTRNAEIAKDAAMKKGSEAAREDGKTITDTELTETKGKGVEAAIEEEEKEEKEATSPNNQRDKMAVVADRTESFLFSSYNSSGRFPKTCNTSLNFRQISIKAYVGNLTLYVYNSAADDTSATARAIKGWHFEKDEIGKFLKVSRDLPIIDVGANLGLVTLQAAKLGKRVVAVEPVMENAMRLCRSVLDFGFSSLVSVIQNAVSSEEKMVSLSMPSRKGRTRYEVRGEEKEKSGWGYGATSVYSVWLDRLVSALPFKKAALKIDVEGHEGHVLAHAERLFREVDIPMVWMEWGHVKKKEEHGGAFIVDFMAKHDMLPYSLQGTPLSVQDDFMKWPFTVLWKRRGE